MDPQTATNNGPVELGMEPQIPQLRCATEMGWSQLTPSPNAPPCPGWHDEELAVRHGLFAPVDTGVAISQLEAWKKMPVLFNWGIPF